VLLELCVQGLASAQAAEAGGADRVELCEALDVGGVTPGPGLIAVACDHLAIPVHVLIRPRGGSFVHDAGDTKAMGVDVSYAREVGAAGVVMGALTREGRVDRATIAALIERARPLSVTFHRAFDASRDPFEALDALLDLGVDRVLTSGRAERVRDGLPLLAELQRRAGDRLTVLAAGRVGVADLAAIAKAGLREAHAASSCGAPGRTDLEAVQRLAKAARLAGCGPAG
jgi:copper homeostasis protein